MAWKNPIPQLDPDFEAKEYSIVFKFQEYVTPEEAVEGINNMIATNGGKIKKEWLHPREKKVRWVFDEQ